METVVNLTKLILLAGVGFVFLLGQGWLVVGPLLHGSVIHRRNQILLLQEFPLMLVSGLTLNYAVLLVIQTVNTSLWVGAGLALCGMSGYIYSIFRDHAHGIQPPASFKTYFLFAFVCLLFLAPILADPLNDWDARSIWFFHAKMIYTAGSTGITAGWQHPSIVFSHADYPNLIPALAAQIAQLMGIWNEYLPKMSLFFMLVPAVSWIFTFSRRSFSFAVLLLLVPFGFSKWLWNGYMDGYLALYFAVAVLLLGRYFKSSHPVDLISSLGCFSLLLSIKNEGALAVVSGLVAMLMIGFLKRKSFRVINILSVHWKYFLAGIFALTPFFLWSIDKSLWNLQDNLGIGTPQSFVRILSRLTDGSYKVILKNVFNQNEGALLLLSTVYFASAVWNKKIPKESLPAFVAAGIYLLGMIMIYLLTPSDLAWQIDTSLDRTMLAVSGCIFVGIYFILNSIENTASDVAN